MGKTTQRMLQAGVLWFGAAGAALAQPCDQQDLVNDSLGTGGNANVCPCFVRDEIALAIFDVPAGDSVQLLQIGIEWKSVLGLSGRTTEDALIVYDLNQTGAVDPATFAPIAELPSPQLRDGFLNVFDVSAGNVILPEKRFGIGLRFRSNQGVLDASIVNDLDGFNNGPETVRNWVFVNSGQWRTSQSLGVNGDWVFRTTVDVCGGAGGLTLENPTPGTAGANNTFVATGATPGASVRYYYGFASGSTTVSGCPGLAVDIRSATLAGSANADGSGTASLVKFVPGVASGRAIRLQAVDAGVCVKSNLVAWTF